jgi:hypothetical protein
MLMERTRLVEWLGFEPSPGPEVPVLEYDVLKRVRDLELSLLFLGVKPAAKLEDLDYADAWRMAEESISHGLSVSIVRQDVGPTPEQRGLACRSGRGVFTLYVSKDGDAVFKLADLDREQKGSGRRRKDAILRSGLLLGYPDCCARFFAALDRQDDARVMAAYRSTAGPHNGIAQLAASGPLLNVFPPLASPVTWYPCSFACKAAAAAAERAMVLLEEGVPERAAAIRDALAGVTLVFDRFRFVHFAGASMEGDTLACRGVADALSFTDAPRFTGSDPLVDFRVEVTSRLSGCDAVRFEKDAVVALCGDREVGRLRPLSPALVVSFPGEQRG